MDGVVVKQDGTKNIAELKVGAEAQLNKQFGLWGNVAQQVGDRATVIHPRR
jgi:autotransporter family porin